MIETQATTAVKPTVDTVVDAARHRTLRLLARVAKRQGTAYSAPSLMIARELFPGLKINAVTWRDVYGGWDYPGDYNGWETLAHYTRRGYVSEVSAGTLRNECLTATVSRETVAVAQVEADEVSERPCTCQSCDEDDNPLCQGDCDPCDDHACTQCHGDDFHCDDHSCDVCYSDHSVAECCNYCSECGSHPNGPDTDSCCYNCGYCNDCEHVCDDVG